VNSPYSCAKTVCVMPPNTDVCGVAPTKDMTIEEIDASWLKTL